MIAVTAISTGTLSLAVPATALAGFGESAPPSASMTISTASVYSVLDLVPGSAVKQGGGPVATGFDATLALDLGRVSAPTAFPDSFRVINRDVVNHQVALTPNAGIAAISSLTFAASGTNQATLSPGETGLVRVSTTDLSAGSFSGTFRVRIDGKAFFTVNQAAAVKQGPAPPATVTAAGAPGGVTVTWSSSPATGVASYKLLRAPASGGPQTVIASGLSGSSYLDAGAAVATDYSYVMRAVASGVSPELEGSDSAPALAHIPPTPTNAAIPAGPNNKADWIEGGSESNVSVDVGLPPGSHAADTVNVKLIDSFGESASGTGPAINGPGTVRISGINATWLEKGSITIEAWLTHGSHLGSKVTGAARKKDNAPAPPAPTSVLIPASAGLYDQNRVNTNNVAAVPLRAVLPSSTPSGTIEFRLTSGASSVLSTVAWAGGGGTAAVTANASSLPDTGSLTITAQVLALNGNRGPTTSASGIKDTVAPSSNLNLVTFTDIPVGGDQVVGAAASTEGSAFVEVYDYASTQTYTTTASGVGAFSLTVAAGTVPRVLRYRFRDPILNWSAPACRSYSITPGPNAGVNTPC